MKIKFKALFVNLLLVFGLMANAQADGLELGQVLGTSGGAQIEVSNIQLCQGQSLSAQNELMFEAMYLTDGIGCEVQQALEASLSISRIVLGITSVGVICSGVGAPLTVILASAQAGLHMVDLVVRNMECVDQRASERNRRLIKQSVCEALVNQGYECDPNR